MLGEFNRVEWKLYARLYAHMEDAGETLTEEHRYIRDAIHGSVLPYDEAKRVLEFAQSDYLANRRR